MSRRPDAVRGWLTRSGASDCQGEPRVRPGCAAAPPFYCCSEAAGVLYALIAGFVSIVILAAVQGIGTSLNTTFSNVTAAIR